MEFGVNPKKAATLREKMFKFNILESVVPTLA